MSSLNRSLESVQIKQKPSPTPVWSAKPWGRWWITDEDGNQVRMDRHGRWWKRDGDCWLEVETDTPSALCAASTMACRWTKDEDSDEWLVIGPPEEVRRGNIVWVDKRDGTRSEVGISAVVGKRCSDRWGDKVLGRPSKGLWGA